MKIYKVPFEIGTKILVNKYCLTRLWDGDSGTTEWIPAEVNGYNIRKGRRPMIRVKVYGRWAVDTPDEYVEKFKYVTVTDTPYCVREVNG